MNVELENASPRLGILRQTSAFAAEIAASLTTRVRRAEGGLLAINASIALADFTSSLRAVCQIVLSGSLLMLLYLHNDLVDGENDRLNPKKNLRRIERLLQRRALLARLLPVLYLSTTAGAYLTLGPLSAAAAAGIIATNAIYCHVAKQTAVLDVVVIGAAGAIFTLVPGVPLDSGVLLLIALMTAASHVFQTLGDREVDARNGIRTIAVLSPRLAFVTLAACCVAAAAVIAGNFGPGFAALAALPLAAQLWLRNAERAWVVSKAGFAVLWLALLISGGVLAERREAPLALVGATVVDLSDFGRSGRDLPNATVLIRGAEIVAVGSREEIEIPAGAGVVDAGGKYLLPGLVDGFAGMNSQAQANAYLYEGVTSIVGVEGPRRGRLALDAAPAPHVYRLDSVGYADRDGDPPPDDAGALAQLEQLAAGGGRVALLMYPLPPARLARVAQRARELGIATIGELGETTYEEAIAAGVLAFVHTSRYSMPLAPEVMRRAVAAEPFGPPKLEYYRYLTALDPHHPGIESWAKRLGASGVGLIPTLALEYLNLPGHRNPWLEPVAKILDPAGIHLPADPKTGEPERPESGADAFPAEMTRKLLELERRYHAAGARYLAGSGTSAFGTMPGISLHHELELLVETGSTPREALAAATSNFNALFGWEEIGCIAPGCRADILVLGADPSADLSSLDRIDQVWLDGTPIDRAALLQIPPKS